MGNQDYIRLSKTISHALRHKPEQYGLTLDGDGWVSVIELLAALGRRRLDVTQNDLVAMLAASDKQRFEIENGRIRALYGHSATNSIARAPAMPPQVLYHGTPRVTLDAITRHGLLPMQRQHVHLTADVRTAMTIARRRPGPHVLLLVDAAGAAAAGVPFYRGNADIWLSGPIPPQFIRVEGQT
ncbi:MAG TPA: RNA 2'-phosphotransferase [Chloroflexota bacterium]|nr:RNA 2'-phosphotransferase [Chloroflexota bacterium]